ncbi:MAG: hypothetical protein U0P45_03775 [Acidimicrobiales bacterium]
MGRRRRAIGGGRGPGSPGRLRAHALISPSPTPPDPGDARLRAHFTGGSLLLVVQEMAQLRRAGAAPGSLDPAPPRPMVRTVQVRRSLATLRACFVDDAVVVDPVRHRALDDATRTKWVAVTMAWADGRWAVQEQRLVRAEPGAHRCG